MTESASQASSSLKKDSPRAKERQDRSGIRRIVRSLFLYAVVPYMTLTILFTLFQRRLIYHLTPSPPLLVANAGFPGDAARDVTLTTDDGLTLHGWLLKADTARRHTQSDVAKSTEPSTPLVFYFPGNAMHRGGRVNDLRDFTALGCDVLIFDYRGYGENPGSPSETAMASDARAIWRLAVDELHVDPSRILLFGESMGGAVAVRLAQELCNEQTPPAGLITNATFASMPRLAACHYPLFPFRWLVWDRWTSVDRMPHVTCPVLMFHGTADQIVPIEEGRELFTAAPQCSTEGCEKTFVEIHGAGHNDIPVNRLRDHVFQLLSVLPER